MMGVLGEMRADREMRMRDLVGGEGEVEVM